VLPTVVGDAAGALALAFGIVCGVFDTRHCGQGRVVDVAIVDMVAMLGGIVQIVHAAGQIGGPGPSRLHDALFYDVDVYTCADGHHVTLDAPEQQVAALLLGQLGLADVGPAAQYEAATWPALMARRGVVRQPAAGALMLAARGQRCLLRPGPWPRRGDGASAQPGVRAQSVDPAGTMVARAAPRFSLLPRQSA
jgi:alpha-methylacyl-CoA racemase